MKRLKGGVATDDRCTHITNPHDPPRGHAKHAGHGTNRDA